MKMIENQVGRDCTDCTLYGINKDGIITLSQTGNVERIPENKSAKEIVKWFDKQIGGGFVDASLCYVEMNT